MSELEVNTQSPPQPDADAMAAMMAKIAKIQKILGVLSYGQYLLGLILLVTPLWGSLLNLQNHSLSLMLIAPFLFGLAYAASFAKKDLSFARVVFRNTAISQLGLFVISIFGIIYGNALLFFIGLMIVALIFGGLAGLVIYQVSKEQK